MISNTVVADIRPARWAAPAGYWPAIVHRKEDGTVEIEHTPRWRGAGALSLAAFDVPRLYIKR